MIDSRTFVCLAPPAIAALMRRATTRVVYAAPGATLEIAAAIIDASKRLGPTGIAVILDVAESTCRLGYGVVDAFSMLRDHNIEIRQSPGLRICFIVVDDEGFIFSSPPLLVEEARQSDEQPNAVRASPEQINKLVRAALPMPLFKGDSPSFPATLRPGQEATKTSGTSGERLTVPEIGIEVSKPQEVRKIEEAVKVNPVENFDLSRIVHVFNTHIQFIEFEVRGTQLQNRTVKLPKELIASIRDPKTKDRITAAFKLVSEGSKVSGERIRKYAAGMRSEYIKNHPNFGGVILKSRISGFRDQVDKLEKEIEEYKAEVKSRFAKEVDKSVEELVLAFWREVVRNPPDELRWQIDGHKPTTEEAKEYLRIKLREVFPSAEDVADDMSVAWVLKDVTWSTLNNQSFIDWLQKQFPLRKELKKPFESYLAAKQNIATH